jgi:hypothetical protein
MAFLNSDRHFPSLTPAITDAALAVTDHGQRRKAHNAAALYRFSDPVHLNQLLLKITFSALIALLPFVIHCHT